MPLFPVISLRFLALCVVVFASAGRLFAQPFPAATQAMPARSLLVGGAATSVDLRTHFGVPEVTGTVVQVDTVMGRYNIELFDDTPLTRANFLAYVEAGRFNNTIVHRSLPGFVVQAGGYHSRLPLEHIATFAPVQNEFRRSNVRGTVAMAKTPGNPNSATSEWFVNLANNNAADLDTQNGGFTVFGRVIGNGMNVINQIAALQRYTVDQFADFPLRNVTQGQTSVQVSNFVTITSVSTVPIYPAGGASVLSFSAQSSNPGVVTATVANSTLVLTAVSAGTANVTVRATETNGAVADSTFAVTVTGGIAISTQPVAQHVQPGAPVTLSVTAQATSPLTYQWRKDGEIIAGATNSTFSIPSAAATDMGFYAVTISGAGTTTSDYVGVTVNVAGGSRLVNVSTRGEVRSGEPLTPGFVMRGTGTKNLVIRAVGPGLGQFGVPSFLADPKMDVIPLGQTAVTVANDNWGDASAASVAALTATSRAAGAFDLPAGSRDAASLASLAVPGSSNGGYTVNVTPAGTATAGVALAEIYDTDAPNSPTRLINVSTLGTVTADGLTPGFVIGGSSPKLLLIRAIGPTLASSFNVGGALTDPTLTIFPLGKPYSVATNNDWASGGQAALAAAFTSAGAFELAGGSRDAAVLVRLPPGAYTAVATGVGGTTGRALVEVYDLDP